MNLCRAPGVRKRAALELRRALGGSARATVDLCCALGEGEGAVSFGIGAGCNRADVELTHPKSEIRRLVLDPGDLNRDVGNTRLKVVALRGEVEDEYQRSGSSCDMSWSRGLVT